MLPVSSVMIVACLRLRVLLGRCAIPSYCGVHVRADGGNPLQTSSRLLLIILSGGKHLLPLNVVTGSKRLPISETFNL
jgi:hypothetical protein